MSKVAIYTGNEADSADNIQRILLSWGEYLKGDYTLEAFGSNSLPESTFEVYDNFVKTTPRSFLTPFDKIVMTYLDCREYITERSPDVLISPWKFRVHGLGIAIAGTLHSTPVITRISGESFRIHEMFDGFKRLGLYVLSRLNRITVSQSDKIIALGPHLRDQLLAHGASEDDVVVLPPPLKQEDRFSPSSNQTVVREVLGLPTDREIALYVGRLTELKGMEFLEEVIESVKGDRDLLFVLVGDGPYREYFSKTYDDDSVRTVGFVPNKDIHKYYQSADVLVHPSPTEGVPLVLLESLECGTPVIARDVCDIPFVTENVVDTPAEMAYTLAEGVSGNSLLNREYFTDSYQQAALQNAIDDVI